MLKKLFRHFLPTVIIIFCFVCCSKNAEEVNPATHFTFTPSEWSTWVRKDWTTITPDLKNMTGFTINKLYDSTEKGYFNKIILPMYDENESIKDLQLQIITSPNNNIIEALYLSTPSNIILTNDKKVAYSFGYYNISQIFGTNDSISKYAQYGYDYDTLINNQLNIFGHDNISLDNLLNVLTGEKTSINSFSALSISPAPDFNTAAVNIAHIFDEETKDSAYLLQLIIN